MLSPGELENTRERGHDGDVPAPMIEGRMGLLERDEYVVQLDTGLASASEGSGLLVSVEGEAGSGKTALVRQYCETHSAQARVLRGTCDPLFTPAPPGPILDVAESAGGELGELVHGIFNAWNLRVSCDS